MLDALPPDVLNTLLSIVCGFLGNAFFYVRGQSAEQTKHKSEDLTRAHEDFTREMQTVIPEVAKKLRRCGKLHSQDTERLWELFCRDAGQGRQVFDRTLESMLVGELGALPVGEEEKQTGYWGVYSTGSIKEALKEARNQAGLKEQVDDGVIDRCLTPIIVELMKAVSRRPELSNLVIQRQLQLMAEGLGRLLGSPSDQTMAMVLQEYFRKQRRIYERYYSIKLSGDQLPLAGNFEFIPPSLNIIQRINGKIPTDFKQNTTPITEAKFKQMVVDGGKILLIAGAGVGKTLFLLHLHLEALRQPPESIRIPVFQNSAEFFNTNENLSSRLEAILKKSVSIQYDSRQAEQVARKSADHGRLCYYLDGLDQADSFSQMKENFLNRPSEYLGDNAVVVACRDEQIQGDLENYRTIFQEFEWIILEPFDTPRLEDYLGPAAIKWLGYDNVFPPRPDKDDYRYEHWSEEHMLLDLLHTPFYANAAKRISLEPGKNNEQLKTRVELLDSFMDILFIEATTKDKGFTSQERTKALRFLRRLSFDTLQKPYKQSFPDDFVLENYGNEEQAIFEKICKSHWIYYCLFEESANVHPASDRHQYAFYHQLLQEYFAAYQICQDLKADMKKMNETKPNIDRLEGLEREELLEKIVDYCSCLQQMPFSEVVLDFLDEILDDKETFEFCMEMIHAAIALSDMKEEGLTNTGNKFTWILAIRDHKGEKPELAGILQSIFDDEMEESKKAEIEGKFVKVPAGPFLMGGYEYDREQPVRVVYLHDYWMSRYAETFEEYDDYCDKRDKDLPDDRGWGRLDRPVINVSWEDTVDYVSWLDDGHNLPTEAQWEKAARGILGRKYPWGNAEPDKEKFNYWVSGHQKTVEVTSYAPYMYCIHQMSGNVDEWCRDSFGRYPPDSVTDPIKDTEGSLRVIRGGAWFNVDFSCRSAHRLRYGPGFRSVNLGFRLART